MDKINNNNILILLLYLLLQKHKNKNIDINLKINKNNNFLNKFKFISDGIVNSFKNDNSIIFAYSLSIPLSILNFIFAPNLISKLLGIILFSFLIIFETLNTSIEATVDRIGLERHILSKLAKDTAMIPSTIISVIFFIFVGIMSYNIYNKYNEYKKIENEQEKKEYIIIKNYIKYSFIN